MTIDPNRAGRDVGRIAEEVLQHLTTLPRAGVRLTLEIEADAPDGIPDDVQRVVAENCQTLKFTSHGFAVRARLTRPQERSPPGRFRAQRTVASLVPSSAASLRNSRSWLSWQEV